jgi:hypothetical protein
MLDDTGKQNLFDQINRIWVEPELARRKDSGSIADDFKIRACLVRLPQGAPPIVEFNDEIGWEVKIRKSVDLELTKGDPVLFSQVQYIEAVLPPMHNGVAVAFFFLFWNGIAWTVLFDCSPNLPDSPEPIDDEDEWTYSPSIANYLNAVLRERAIHNHDLVKLDIKAIALWPAPSLLPYPLSAICELCRVGRPDDARALLVDHCTSEFLTAMVARWDKVAAFRDRSQLFHDALQAHIDQRYTLSISALMPHLEGVVTDWIFTKIPPGEVPYRQESKTKKLRELIEAGTRRTYTDQRVAETVVEFILDGPVLQSFANWLSPVSTLFPNRHVIGHGKFDVALYTQENSVKVLLMLDTLYSVIASADG